MVQAWTFVLIFLFFIACSLVQAYRSPSWPKQGLFSKKSALITKPLLKRLIRYPIDPHLSTTKLHSNAAANSENQTKLPLLAGLGVIAALVSVFTLSHYIDFSSVFEQAVELISGLGPLGYVYFAMIYIAAEILAIPAVPLTASSGYLFGLVPGTLTVLCSATVAASISFLIGRTYLRSWAQGFIQESPRWRAIDKAISKQGFKVVLLLRLSPLLPFALSNYLYGVTSVDFASFITATFLGFAPGSFGIVYFGTAGKTLLSEGGLSSLSLPWYAYVAAGLGITFLVQTIGRVATEAVKQMEAEEGEPGAESEENNDV
eukprot:gene26550-32087_t